MTTEEILKILGDRVSAKTSKPLNNLQWDILRATLEGKAYKDIVKELKEQNKEKNNSYVRKVGSELWQRLSEVLGQDINKNNIRAIVETIFNISNFSSSVVQDSFNNLSLCPNLDKTNGNQGNGETVKPEITEIGDYDLKNMPRRGTFYNRISELATLKTAILEDNCALVALTGITGIGKTALATQLVHQIKDKFDYILWYNLQNRPNFTDFQTRFNALLSPEKNDTPLIDYCQNYRCLIILDNYHHLFTPTELAGKYLPETENWQQFLQQITTLSHQSCLIIISQELPKEIDDVTDDYTHIKILELNGLDPDTTSQMFGKICAFIDFSLYQGHPAYAKSMALMEKKLGQNNMEILAKKAPIFPQDLQLNFDQAFDRLSAMEKQIIFILARENYPINLDQLENTAVSTLMRHNLICRDAPWRVSTGSTVLDYNQKSCINISPTELANALQSLNRRGLFIQDDDGLSLDKVFCLYLTVSNTNFLNSCYS